MKRRIGTVGAASAVTASLLLIVAIAGLALPVRGQRMDGPLGADCILMAQALRSTPPPYRVIGSDRTCHWRDLGFPRALGYEQLLPGIEVASSIVEAPRYSLGGYKAEVGVGVSLAALAGSEQDCTYYRFWGTWHRAGCVESWVA
jgi:hypothetical protein